MMQRIVFGVVGLLLGLTLGPAIARAVRVLLEYAAAWP